MVSNKLDQKLASREFEYGNHTIVVEVHMKHTYLSNASVDYGSSGRNYYRKVRVYAHLTEDWEDADDDEEVDTDASNYSACQVRAESYEPNIEIPDDPTLSIFQLVALWLDDEMTRSEMKERIRQDKRQRKQERTIPSGPRVELETQIEETVRPVLETVDNQYRVLNEDVEIDIEVSVDRMSAEVSWVEVDDEMERITKELENISEM